MTKKLDQEILKIKSTFVDKHIEPLKKKFSCLQGRIVKIELKIGKLDQCKCEKLIVIEEN